MAVEPAIVAIALGVRPDQVTLVPERRAELTTEGGLDVVGQHGPGRRGGEPRCRDAGLEVALFIDPEPGRSRRRLGLRRRARSSCTPGRYADAPKGRREPRAGSTPGAGRRPGSSPRGLALHAGHGLNYRNVGPVARLDRMAELNIGHSIVSRAVFVGMERAVREMKACIERSIDDTCTGRLTDGH